MTLTWVLIMVIITLMLLVMRQGSRIVEMERQRDSWMKSYHHATKLFRDEILRVHELQKRLTEDDINE